MLLANYLGILKIKKKCKKALPGKLLFRDIVINIEASTMKITFAKWESGFDFAIFQHWYVQDIHVHVHQSISLHHYLLLKCVFTILIFPLPVHSTHNSCTWEYSSSSNLLALSACFTNDPEDQHERQCYNNHESARLKYTNKLLKIIEYYMSIT